MQDRDRRDDRVRARGTGFCVDEAQLYVWEADADEAARAASELLDFEAPAGVPPGGS